jgi:signal transduction histidine kinase
MGQLPGQLRGKRANGQEFPIEAMISQVEVAGQKLYTVILRDISQRQQLEQEKAQLFEAVNRQRNQLRALTNRLAEVQEAERKELARELHDQLGRDLSALDLNLSVIQTLLAETTVAGAPLQARLADSLALVKQMGHIIRVVMANLRPPVLDDYGLVAALRWYGAELATRVPFSITVQGEALAPRLPAPVELAFFRIAQEALTNIAKHAQAHQASITVAEAEGLVHLVIHDDGLGFDPDQRADPVDRQSWGLITMAERAEAVGATCRVESVPGQGTQVIVEIARPKGDEQ